MKGHEKEFYPGTNSKNKKNKKERMKEIPQTDPDLQHTARAHRHREVKNNQVTHRLDSGVQIIYSAH